MDRASPKRLSWSLPAASLAAPLLALARRFLASLHETRRQEAMRMIERYRDLAGDTDPTLPAATRRGETERD